jgi:hypothetical protein
VRPFIPPLLTDAIYDRSIDRLRNLAEALDIEGAKLFMLGMSDLCDTEG